MAVALVYMAEALHQQGELTWPAELCGFLLRWPGTPHHIREAADNLAGKMKVRLPPEEADCSAGARRATQP